MTFSKPTLRIGMLLGITGILLYRALTIPSSISPQNSFPFSSTSPPKPFFPLFISFLQRKAHKLSTNVQNSTAYHAQTSWETYFEGNYTNITANNTFVVVHTNFWVYHSIFQDIHADNSCICKNSTNLMNMLVQLSQFFNCSSNNDGGAIFFTNEGQCVITTSCGYKCCTDQGKSGQFCYIHASNSSANLYKNYLIDSSISLTYQTQMGSKHYIIQMERYIF